jgi:hypothetical protein
MHTSLVENLKGRDHFGDLSLDEMILKCITQKQVVKMCTGCN